MPQCPNCGRATSRTEDWACQWCGYPLLSSSYKKIPKTYQQLKEEELYIQEAPVAEEAAAPPVSDDIPLPEAPPEPEPKPEPPPVEIEVAQKQEAPVAEEVVAPPAGDAIPLPEAPPEPEPESKPKPEPEPEPKPEPEPEPKPEPPPVAMEVTVDDLLSAYREQGEAADKRFADKILSLTSRLVKEQTATVRGRYNGSIIDIRMRDCVLVQP
jgi:hypothetical protein